MPLNRVKYPVILGIVGDSAAGKTTLTAGVTQILGAERVAVVCTDDYHRYSRAERAKNGISALDPRGNYIDIVEQHLRLLREGKPILDPPTTTRPASSTRRSMSSPSRTSSSRGSSVTPRAPCASATM